MGVRIEDGENMTTVAENLAGQRSEKEKVEKRRALGRGLESLLPGPRVVPAEGAGRAGGERHTRVSARFGMTTTRMRGKR